MLKQAVVALGGNPNTGKSTLFNNLTGLKQHTGNWPGKTVQQGLGSYIYRGQAFEVVDLPGTYSLLANSPEEEVARDFLCLERPDVTVIIIDSTSLERNLNLVLQVLEITNKVVICANFMDEVRRLGLRLDLPRLEQELGVPVIPTSGLTKEGLAQLKDVVYRIINGQLKTNPVPLRYPDSLEKGITQLLPILKNVPPGINKRWVALQVLRGEDPILHKMGVELLSEQRNTIIPTDQEGIVTAIYRRAGEIADRVVLNPLQPQKSLSYKIDQIVTSRTWGIPIMLVILAAIFWLTIVGANYPSDLLMEIFEKGESWLFHSFTWLKFPRWFTEMFIFGLYRGLAWVVAVMLPPMAIFFPLFTLLEDLGYLPRAAFNLDYFFQKAATTGKQSLTMAMGFGCNAAGVIACRIIESPRERLAAVLTNSFMPCNGRFPMLILLGGVISSLLFNRQTTLLPPFIVLGAILLGVGATLAVSKLLTATILKGKPSFFALELPPYRKPNLTQVLYRSFVDRTLFVLGRAVIVAAPAGLITWLLTNLSLQGQTAAAHLTNWLEPLGRLMGLDGVILLAFLLGLPANEIVIPIMLMLYLKAGSLLPLEGIGQVQELLLTNGWGLLTLLNFVIFTVFHWPCATTLLTIKKETGNLRWMLLAALIPTLLGFLICLCTATIGKIVI